jgi:hypothetical protein
MVQQNAQNQTIRNQIINKRRDLVGLVKENKLIKMHEINS